MKSVEHLGPGEKLYIKTKGRTVLHIDPEFELNRFRFMVRLIAKHAVEFEKAPYDERFVPMQRKQGSCYDNAYALVLSYPSHLTYCEGVVDFIIGDRHFPLPHAWACTRDGKVVDPTFRETQNDPEHSYLGIGIKTDYLMRWVTTYGFPGLLDGHPTLDDTVGLYVDPPAIWKAIGLD